MRRTRRNFAAMGAAVSLLMALAVGAIWVRSYWHADGWGRSNYLSEKREMRMYVVGSERGRVGLDYFCLNFNPAAELRVTKDGTGGTVYLVPYFAMTYSGKWNTYKIELPNDPPQHIWERAGICVRRSSDPIRHSEPTGHSTVFIAAPYWLIVVVFSLWPVVWMAAWWRRRRKIAAGLCLNCGYDLRASIGRCPECGAVSG